jgi:hypothetical protein
MSAKTKHVSLKKTKNTTSYGTGGALKIPSYKYGGKMSLLSKISNIPNKPKLKGCGCGGSIK